MSPATRQMFTIPATVGGMLASIGTVRVVSEELFWTITAVFLGGLCVIGLMRMMWLTRHAEAEDMDIVSSPTHGPIRIDADRQRQQRQAA